MRWFRAHNSLKGFFGFSEGFYPDADYGEAACLSPDDFHGAPCLVFDKKVRESSNIGKFNLTYRINDSKGDGAASFCAKPLLRCQSGNSRTHGVNNSPATKQGANSHGCLAGQDHPERHMESALEHALRV